MTIIISRDIKGARYTVVFDGGDGEYSKVSFYRGADRVARGVWDGEDFSPSFTQLAESLDESERIYDALAEGVRERLAVDAAGGLTPWPDASATLRRLAKEAGGAAHDQLDALILLTACMQLVEVDARLNAAANLWTSSPPGRTWTAAERAILDRAVAVLRERAVAN